jgi:pimeloyl-ACP methyl ester carboxylesterase
VNGPDEVDPDPGAFVDLRVEGPEGGVAVRGRGLDGAARPVLALPGLGSNARLWDALAWRLAAAGHPVAVLDLPGHGSSDRPARGFSWPGLVAAVTGVCASRAWTGDARRPVLAGHHLGADLAVEVAAAHPGLAEALVLMDGGATELSGRFADWPTCEVALAPSVPEGSDGARTARMLRAVHADWPDDALAGALADLDWHADGTVGPRLRGEDHLALLRLLWDHHPDPALRRLSIPVTVVVPEADEGRGRFTVGPRDELGVLIRACPTATVTRIRGDSELHAQHPGLLADLIEDTCAGRRRGWRRRPPERMEAAGYASARAAQQVSTTSLVTT